MTDEELQTGITEMTLDLDRRNADDKIQSVRDALQEIIETHPDTPGADAALRSLEGLTPKPEVIYEESFSPPPSSR